jgi:bifunctional non-homologous end joining protein LigD
VHLVSRNARDLTRRFPDLVAAMAKLEVPTLLLDGEIAVFDRQLLSRFEWLRGRPKDETATPPILIAFDCLHAHGKDLRERPLRVRRNVLEALLEGQNLVLPARRLAENGLDAWDEVLERGYEGLVGKDDAALYREGRTLSWLKVKQPKYREGERGWEPKA